MSRHGVMVLSWTQDRLGPMCRYAEDCALVLHAIAKPDDQDLSVQDIPFNWNARRDLRTIRLGFLEDAFDQVTNDVSRAADAETLQHLRALGFTPVPIAVPEFTLNVTAYLVEEATFFDDALRDGRTRGLLLKNLDQEMRDARVVPAVEFLRSQRARMMMMTTLADATQHVDVWVAPGNAGTVGATGTGPTAKPAAPATPSVAGRHNNLAQLAGYPAVAIPNGFSQQGLPTSVTFFARPFCETELLTVVKAYQDQTGVHRKHPRLDR